MKLRDNHFRRFFGLCFAVSLMAYMFMAIIWYLFMQVSWAGPTGIVIGGVIILTWVLGGIAGWLTTSNINIVWFSTYIMSVIFFCGLAILFVGFCEGWTFLIMYGFAVLSFPPALLLKYLIKRYITEKGDNNQ